MLLTSTSVGTVAISCPGRTKNRRCQAERMGCHCFLWMADHYTVELYLGGNCSGYRENVRREIDYLFAQPSLNSQHYFEPYCWIAKLKILDISLVQQSFPMLIATKTVGA